MSLFQSALSATASPSVNAHRAGTTGVVRKRARKIRCELGPFETDCSTFDRGMRKIEIVRITPAAIVYRLLGTHEEYTLPHGVAFLKALSVKTTFDVGPRSGAIRRGS